MTQQLTWRCEKCEAVVTAASEDGRRYPSCPICHTSKDAGPAEGYDARAGSRFAETAGPELDRVLARRILGGQAETAVPPYSSEDLAATALAELVGRQSDWSFHIAFCGNAWMATFTEKTDRTRDSAPVAAFVSASGLTRSLAICRALLKVTRCPRWNPLGTNFLRAAQPAISRAAGLSPRILPPGITTT